MRGDSMSIRVTTRRLNMEFRRVRAWLCEFRLSQDVTLYPRGGK